MCARIKKVSSRLSVMSKRPCGSSRCRRLQRYRPESRCGHHCSESLPNNFENCRQYKHCPTKERRECTHHHHRRPRSVSVARCSRREPQPSKRSRQVRKSHHNPQNLQKIQAKPKQTHPKVIKELRSGSRICHPGKSREDNGYDYVVNRVSGHLERNTNGHKHICQHSSEQLQEHQQQQMQPPGQIIQDHFMNQPHQSAPTEMEELRRTVFRGIKQFSRSLRRPTSYNLIGAAGVPKIGDDVKRQHKRERFRSHRSKSRIKDWKQIY